MSDHPLATLERSVSSNGAHPVMPKHYVWVDVDAEHYPGFRCEVWTNFPQRIRLDLRSNDQARISAAIQQVIRAHNGWCDCDGEPLPDADSPDFLDAVPTELLAFALRAAIDAGTAIPNSLAPTRRR